MLFLKYLLIYSGQRRDHLPKGERGLEKAPETPAFQLPPKGAPFGQVDLLVRRFLSLDSLGAGIK
jgi:hypothetical protein